MTEKTERAAPRAEGLTRRTLLKSAPATGLALGSGAFAGTLASTTAPAGRTGQSWPPASAR
jgi:hypothetical protein